MEVEAEIIIMAVVVEDREIIQQIQKMHKPQRDNWQDHQEQELCVQMEVLFVAKHHVALV